jgi:hypothetical protein
MYTKAEDQEERRRSRVDDQLVNGIKYLDRVMAYGRGSDVDIESLRVRAPRSQADDYLVVIRGIDAAGGRVVGFHGAPGLADALAGVCNRIRNGSLKWVKDKYND